MEKIRDRSAASGAASIGSGATPAIRPEGRAPALLRGTPREVLARISEGDPLEVRPRVARVLAREALLLDADRVHLRALVHTARAAALARGSVDARRSGDLLDRAAERAVREAVRESRAAGSRPSGGRARDLFEALAPHLGLDAQEAREAAAAFNECDPEDRRACFALLVEGRSLDELARGGSATEIASRARRALGAALAKLGTPERASERKEQA